MQKSEISMKSEDFDSMSSSSSTVTSVVGPNGQEVYRSESTKSSSQNNEYQEKIEEYQAPKLPDYEDPNQVYEDTNEESHTFKRLNGELDSEQNHVANQADNAADLERLIGDYSYQEGDYYDYKGDRYLISDIDNPANLLMTPERAEQLDARKEDSDARIFDSLLSNWSLRK